MVTRYGQADIPREVSGRRVDHRSAQAADFPSIPFIQYVHIRCCIKNNCANCTLKWEIQWFDGELFIDTCMTSPAKRADVACLVKPEGRRPDPLFNIPKDYNWPRKSQNMDMDLFHILSDKENRIRITGIYCRLTPCIRRHFAMFGDSSQFRACFSVVHMNG